MKNRAGPWSAEDKQFISDQAGKLSPEDIAEHLHRNPKAVIKYMNQNGLMKYYHKKDLEKDELQNIRRTKYWDILVDQFTEEELDIFQYHWKNIVRQFRDDIFHTEELQIIDAIKLEIMMNRCQKKQKQAQDLILEMRGKIEQEHQQPDPDEDKIRDFERVLSSCFAGSEALSKEFTSLLKEKKDAFKQLKATREQRVQQIESSKESLVGWLKEIYSNPKTNYELGLDMEKRRIAAEQEFIRLSEFHKYADGEIDKPILNEDTV